MTRTNIDIDDEACAEVMKRYGLSTKREAVNFAIRILADNGLTIGEARAPYDVGRSDSSRQPEPQEDITYRRATIEEARRMRGETDFDAVPTREEWLYRPLVPVKRPSLEEVRALRGIGWQGNLDEMRRNTPQLEAWLNGPDDEPMPDPDIDDIEDGQSP